MTAQQTSVVTQTAGIAGTIADDCPHYIRSYQNEDATEMGIGICVKVGTDPDTQVKLPSSQAAVFGVTMHSHAYAKPTELGDTGLKQYVTVGVMRKGTVKVYCSEAVVVGTSAVRIRIDTTAGTGDLLGPGTFCVSSNTTHTVLVTSGMKWVKGCGAGGIAHLEVDMTCFAITNDS